MNRKLAVLFVIAGGLSGCGAPMPGAGVGEVQSPIVGGVSDPNDPAVILVMASNNQGESLCTGEIISPHVVLTAAHCVDPATVGNNVTFQVFLGNDINNQTQANNPLLYVDVASTTWDMKFNVNQLQNGNDIGIVVTKTAMTPTPLPMNRTALTQNDQGSTVRLIGYGITSGTDTNGVSAGTKRQTSTTIDQVSNLFLLFDDPKHLTCEGDSGGPAMLMQNGVEVIAGITSFGDQGCTMDGYDTNIQDYLSFIDPFIAANDPGQMMAANPDMATTQQGNPDMAMSQTTTGNPDLATAVTAQPDMASNVGLGNNAGTQKVGGACEAHADCASGTCAFTTATTGYCTAKCDPAKPECPTGMTCGLIDNVDYCIFPAAASPTRGGASGCSIAGAGSPASSGAPLLLALLLPALLFRSRRRRA